MQTHRAGHTKLKGSIFFLTKHASISRKSFSSKAYFQKASHLLLSNIYECSSSTQLGNKQLSNDEMNHKSTFQKQMIQVRKYEGHLEYLFLIRICTNTFLWPCACATLLLIAYQSLIHPPLHMIIFFCLQLLHHISRLYAVIHKTQKS